MDTSAYTHLCRAGHESIIGQLAPGGVVLVPDDVSAEIDQGRDWHGEIPSVAEAPWAELAVLTDEEVLTQVQIKAQLGGTARQHLGECAVIACAHHRSHIAILDDRGAVQQAEALNVPWHDTLWIVIEAYKGLYRMDRARTAAVVDDLVRTGLYLPFDDGRSLFAWAYVEGLLP